MVGTFYSAPGQDAAPFVEIGDRVRVGQILCIIEAMKLMNEIEAEFDGDVLKCHIQNGQPVEFGEPLFDLRPAGASKKR
jgi:acetyl-CoA carboxylase biotin carboxyl carrier protein